MNAKYEVKSLVDLARIPEEAFPRFQAELDQLMGMIREHLKVVDAMADELPEDERAEYLAESEDMLLEHMVWTDDGINEMSIETVFEDEDTGEKITISGDSEAVTISGDSWTVENIIDQFSAILKRGRANPVP